MVAAKIRRNIPFSVFVFIKLPWFFSGFKVTAVVVVGIQRRSAAKGSGLHERENQWQHEQRGDGRRRQAADDGTAEWRGLSTSLPYFASHRQHARDHGR